MNKTFFKFGAVLTAVIGLSVSAQAQGSSDLYSGTTLITLQKPQLISASATNSSGYVSTAGLDGVAIGVLTVTNSAATGTLDTKLQGSDDLTTWTDVTGGAFTQVGTSNSVQIIALRNLPLYLRATNTVASSGTYYYSVSILARSKYRN